MIVLINVFTVAPRNQAKLIELLSSATSSAVRHEPGFVGAGLHRSLDGTKVTMYARWRTIEDYQRRRSNPRASPVLGEALTIATLEPGMYEVVETFAPPAAP